MLTVTLERKKNLDEAQVSLRPVDVTPNSGRKELIHTDILTRIGTDDDVVADATEIIPQEKPVCSEAGSDWKVSDSLIPAIINSKSIVFCGAGISTNCGIPDYRSDKRLYQKSNLKDVFDLPCDNSSLPSFWKMHGELYDKCNGALPSTAHWMIACLVQMRKTLRVWNQNVGMIFGKCGLSQPEVVDLHGSDGVIRCVGGHNLPFDANIYQAMSNGDVENLRCSVVHRTTYGRENICRHAVIPGILYYGDNISPRIENFVSLDLTSNVGIVLVLGTSLKIPSYVNLLRTYLHHNPKAKFVIVAKEELTKS